MLKFKTNSEYSPDLSLTIENDIGSFSVKSLDVLNSLQPVGINFLIHIFF